MRTALAICRRNWPRDGTSCGFDEKYGTFLTSYGVSTIRGDSTRRRLNPRRSHRCPARVGFLLKPSIAPVFSWENCRLGEMPLGSVGFPVSKLHLHNKASPMYLRRYVGPLPATTGIQARGRQVEQVVKTSHAAIATKGRPARRVMDVGEVKPIARAMTRIWRITRKTGYIRIGC